MLNLRVVAILALAGTMVASAGAAIAGTGNLHHRHSFLPSRAVEPTADNFKNTKDSLKIVGLNGYWEWQVTGPVDELLAFAGVNKIHTKEQSADSPVVQLQWSPQGTPILRPPFVPTYVPGVHVVLGGIDKVATIADWTVACAALERLVGGMDCKAATVEAKDPGMIGFSDFLTVASKSYIHRSVDPTGFAKTGSVLGQLLHRELQSENRDQIRPLLVDLDIKPSVVYSGDISKSTAVLKILWQVNHSAADQSITVQFDDKTDAKVEIGYFYRELFESQDRILDPYIGMTVTFEAGKDAIQEALIHVASSVFPPLRMNGQTGEITTFGHGYNNTMTPAQTFHTHSITQIRSNPDLEETTRGCDLVVLQVLPSSLFVDPFQLKDLAPEIGESVVYGETDLEKPVGVVAGWGSLVMVKVQPAENLKATSRWIANVTGQEKEIASGSMTATVDIPMHMRYQPPVAQGKDKILIQSQIPWPLVSWVCKRGSPSNVVKMRTLFESRPLPLSLLVKDTDELRFLVPQPVPEQYPFSRVSVPTGDLEDREFVQTATFMLAFAGTMVVVAALVKVMSNRGVDKGKQD